MSHIHYDLIIVGAGPIGIEAGIRAKRAGLSYLILEKGCIVNAIAQYPTYMTFFTTSERLEVGGHPLITAIDKPTRKEALDYYRKVVHNERLELKAYTEVTDIRKTAQGFELTSVNDRGQKESWQTSKVAVATGYFDNPKFLKVPGEDLPNVSHYFTEAHPYYNRPVTIIGAGSSAADAALDLFKAGAKVTMVHRGEDFRHSLKYWIRPNLENRVKEGSIVAHFNSVVKEISSDEVVIEKQGEIIRIPSVQTFALTGYFASTRLLEAAGVSINAEDFSAQHSTDTFETNVPGLYVLGSAGYGTRTSDVFIENGLVHVEKAMKDIVAKSRLEPQKV
ncbi:MAG: YpdA family putative bacillithiol disulfide reductase [Trueperaceae bacterium]|nr:YpdA family putative bacillithiol disulfide reductase [Trueperaceae bacterium]